VRWYETYETDKELVGKQWLGLADMYSEDTFVVLVCLPSTETDTDLSSEPDLHHNTSAAQTG
jgi:hypothetical protein